MSNDEAPTRIRALKIGAQAVGALAVGALAVGAVAVGPLAIGRLVIGRSRIRRLEIDELVVARLHVTEALTGPSTPAADNIGATKQQSGRFNQPTTADRAINKALRASRWARARPAAQLSAPSTWPKERAKLFDSRGCARSRRQAISCGASRVYAVGTKRHRMRYGITQERTAVRGIRRTFTFRRRKAGDPEVLSRPLQADSAVVFSTARRLSPRSFSTIDRRVPGLRADTPVGGLIYTQRMDRQFLPAIYCISGEANLPIHTSP